MSASTERQMGAWSLEAGRFEGDLKAERCLDFK